jgi:hypothetical protein
MRSIRTLMLCVVALVALAAWGSVSASALPEWGKCKAKAGGKYTDSNCTKKAKIGMGSFEFVKLTKAIKFAGEDLAGRGVLLTTERLLCDGGKDFGRRVSRKACEKNGGKLLKTAREVVECEREDDRGETSGSKGVANVSVKFIGCGTIGGSCSNGPTGGEIKANSLKGTLGYISKKKRKLAFSSNLPSKKASLRNSNAAVLPAPSSE